MRGLLILTLLTAGAPAVAMAAVSEPAARASGQGNVSADVAAAGPTEAAAPQSAPEGTATAGGENLYGGHTDEELTALAAHWDSLDRHQRRALLTEMKLRMARKGDHGVIHIRTERRYGRIIRQPDGRVIHIETQVVHVRPLDPADLQDRQSFGVGFEQRIGRRQHELDARSAAEAASPAPPGGDVHHDGQPSLNGVLDSLVPSTQAPQVNRLPVYQVSDPKP